MKPSRDIPATMLLIYVVISATFVCTRASELPTPVVSAWSQNPVTIDGEMTSSDEWGEAMPVDVAIGKYDTGANFNMRIWAKNDKTDLYLLYRVPYHSSLYDDADDAGISYFWPEWDPLTGWENNDAGFCSINPRFEGQTRDYYGWDETRFYKDVEATPPGENNFEGSGTYDGSYYWFEMKKPLNSGDGYDWNFELGETYGWHEGTPGKSDDLVVYFFDESKELAFNGLIRLAIASEEKSGPFSPSGGGGITWSMELITGFITIGAAGVAVVSWMTRTQRARRKKKILFERFLGEVDNVYSDFKLNTRRCETELHKLNNDVLSEFKQGTLDEEHYDTLNRRIEDYMKEVHKRIDEENP